MDLPSTHTGVHTPRLFLQLKKNLEDEEQKKNLLEMQLSVVENSTYQPPCVLHFSCTLSFIKDKRERSGVLYCTWAFIVVPPPLPLLSFHACEITSNDPLLSLLFFYSFLSPPPPPPPFFAAPGPTQTHIVRGIICTKGGNFGI